MMDNAARKSAPDCDVCGLAHDEQIHEATLSIHRWFREQVTQYFGEPVESEEAEAQVA